MVRFDVIVVGDLDVDLGFSANDCSFATTAEGELYI
ncbi:hypothetical protein HKBW3S06_00463 [Candidatus Hakubella thermalkaliphila]|uniref:Uncharacterized protein n=1 Tax=Candidatus Hakubella thermalkaliphila TaxID=2754717 RepID=A0A6V8PZ93_9ACTN|nr:hypothetical protein [Actinomycetota bacterium]GFP21237.1 hypothetical protein HKBW3S06_00463 [Candidatus Hakubella thermalkaliphila]GFP30983.1 hypothetical protein HKBW3S34_01902 [Candidatus Hakubella thermalkaliphila]GFP37553.1 hypothetical protein HKBW3S44_01231 [Candidatus Hakubella thermalkaliphila]GFP38563.1 hypothetical protein HKBW3S47_00264 [Candidatus Hakubella thermalkaliphila]